MSNNALGSNSIALAASKLSLDSFPAASPKLLAKTFNGILSPFGSSGADVVSKTPEDI
jgi:hypothetical protein